MSYTVFVDDNFHYQEEDERYCLGEFETFEAAVSACKNIVDEFLKGNYKPSMDGDALYENYVRFGEDPFIVGKTPCPFSAWDYAKQRSVEICEFTKAGVIP